MEASSWITQHWFDLFQTAGIIGGLLFTAYTVRREGRARKISSLIALKQQHLDIWKDLYEKPKLFRVLKKNVDLSKHPITDEESLFVKFLILHLDTVRRAMDSGLFVKLEGLQTDVSEFFSAPIPKAIWEQLKPLQDKDHVTFVDACLRDNPPRRRSLKSILTDGVFRFWTR